ncbi:MAG TPA: hypothetical protein VFW22_15725, partial [Pseudolabrys sp.]|nr:hypothetical protein [Pseudolabrys sp.]
MGGKSCPFVTFAHHNGCRLDLGDSGGGMVNLLLTPCRQSHFRASPQGCGGFSREPGVKCGIRATDGDKTAVDGLEIMAIVRIF